MAWIEAHDDIWEHHKTLQLCKLLDRPDYAVVGHLFSLWHFVLRNAWRDSNLQPWGEAGVERAARWDGKPGVFIAAVREVGCMDEFIVHGWQERAGKLVNDRHYNEERRKNASLRRKADATLPNPTLPHPTLPNPTQPNQKTKTLRGAAAPRSAKLAKKISETTPFWKELIAHLMTTWEAKKNKGNPDPKYPARWVFDVKWAQRLKTIAGLYQPFGVMALWDEFLRLEDAWAKASGHSFEMFMSKLPSLVDGAQWRTAARKYETQYCGPIEAALGNVLGDMTKNWKVPSDAKK